MLPCPAALARRQWRSARPRCQPCLNNDHEGDAKPGNSLHALPQDLQPHRNALAGPAKLLRFPQESPYETELSRFAPRSAPRLCGAGQAVSAPRTQRLHVGCSICGEESTTEVLTSPTTPAHQPQERRSASSQLGDPSVALPAPQCIW